jgi:hypothetical protein
MVAVSAFVLLAVSMPAAAYDAIGNGACCASDNTQAGMVQRTSTVRTLGTLDQDEVDQAAPASYPSAIGGSAMVAAPSSSAASTPLQAMRSGSVTYITGGVGDEERDALEAVKASYNLHILISTKNGEFIAETQVNIRDAKNNVLATAVAGPIFYANLPDGAYTIEASNGGVTQTHHLIVKGRKITSLSFRW